MTLILWLISWNDETITRAIWSKLPWSIEQLVLIALISEKIYVFNDNLSVNPSEPVSIKG